MWDYLQQTEKPVVLYGTGNACQRILAELKRRGIMPAGIIASDGFVRGQTFEGYRVSTYAQMKAICDRFFEAAHPTLKCPFENEEEIISSMIVLLCFGTDRPEVIENIKKIEAEQELYAPDLPVVGDGLFTREYYEAHFDELDWLNSVLTDERSREVLSNVTGYRLTGDLQYLRAAEDPAEDSGRCWISDRMRSSRTWALIPVTLSLSFSRLPAAASGRSMLLSRKAAISGSSGNILRENSGRMTLILIQALKK